MEDDVQAPADWEAEYVLNDLISEEPGPVTRKDKKPRRSPEMLESESKKMRHEEPFHSNGEAGKRKSSDETHRVNKQSDSETERNSSRRNRSPRRNRSRSRSPHRRNSRSPRRSISPHKRGDPRSRNQQICYDYARGRCNKDSACKFVHDEPEDGNPRWSRERDDAHHEKTRAARDSNPRDPRKDHPRDLKDPKDSRGSRDPREKSRKKEENNEQQQQRIEQNQVQAPEVQAPQVSVQTPQVQAPQVPDWTNLQPVNQMSQMSQWNLTPFASSSIAASLQALQEQNFKIPPPPPPGGPPGADPRVQPAAGDPRVPATTTEESKKSSGDPVPGESDEKQNGEADAGEGEVEVENSRKSKKDGKAAMMVRLAVTEYVKEVLKPTWKEGNLSKDVYKTIAKKAVDKVVGTLQSHQIPRSADKVDHFMDFSRQKISKLVQGYVEKYTSSSK